MTPVIGITAGRTITSSPLPFVHISESYMRAVTRAGGIPLVVPAVLPLEKLRDLAGKVDAILVTGGGDIDPLRFDGESHPRVYDIDEDRDSVEIGLVQLAAETGLPFLGICRGIQVINVALGGTLITDIGDQVPTAQRHDWYPDIPRDYLAHPVTLAADSRLAKILGQTEVQVNSLHHQSIKSPASALKVTGYAPDGVIESVELPDHPFGIGVQWHPEWLQHLPEMRAIFRSLVVAGGR